MLYGCTFLLSPVYRDYIKAYTFFPKKSTVNWSDRNFLFTKTRPTGATLSYHRYPFPARFFASALKFPLWNPLAQAKRFPKLKLTDRQFSCNISPFSRIYAQPPTLRSAAVLLFDNFELVIP
jgi:hypothetical protein